MVCSRRIEMPKCPHCHKEINTLDHGINANCIFTAKLVKGMLDMGDEHGASPHTFDTLSEWYSCPECKGSIVDEADEKYQWGSEQYRAAERFLNGVKNYKEDKPK
jgi:hypothetical protein